MIIPDTEDLIFRGDAILAAYERIKQIGYENDPKVLSIRQAIREVPAQTERNERKTEYWILHHNPNVGICLQDQVECSGCGKWMCARYLTYRDYCPACGAKMENEIRKP